jgi:hypothetical protein
MITPLGKTSFYTNPDAELLPLCDS